jgi:hypothetical protein
VPITELKHPKRNNDRRQKSMTATTQTPPGVDQLDRIALNLAHHLAHLSTVAESTRKSDLYQTVMRAIPEKERAKFFQKA